MKAEEGTEIYIAQETKKQSQSCDKFKNINRFKEQEAVSCSGREGRRQNETAKEKQRVKRQRYAMIMTEKTKIP